MIGLWSVYETPVAKAILYDLLEERTPEVSISHTEIPTFEQHVAFVDSRPYRAWYLIYTESPNPYIGATYLTHANEIGIFIFKRFHGRGYAKEALKLLMERHDPLPEVKGVSRGTFIAHVNPANEASKALFESLGGRLIQITYELPAVSRR